MPTNSDRLAEGDRLRREILGEVCRRIGHEWGEESLDTGHETQG